MSEKKPEKAIFYCAVLKVMIPVESMDDCLLTHELLEEFEEGIEAVGEYQLLHQKFVELELEEEKEEKKTDVKITSVISAIPTKGDDPASPHLKDEKEADPSKVIMAPAVVAKKEEKEAIKSTTAIVESTISPTIKEEAKKEDTSKTESPDVPIGLMGYYDGWEGNY